MVTDATKKLREPVAYILLAFAGLVALALLIRLFVGSAGFTNAAAVVQGQVTPPTLQALVLLVSLAASVWLVNEAGERTPNARTVTLAALSITGLLVLIGLIVAFASFGETSTAGLKITSFIFAIGGLALYGVAGIYILKTYQSLPAPVRVPKASPQGQFAGQQGQYGAPGQYPQQGGQYGAQGTQQGQYGQYGAPQGQYGQNEQGQYGAYGAGAAGAAAGAAGGYAAAQGGEQQWPQEQSWNQGEQQQAWPAADAEAQPHAETPGAQPGEQAWSAEGHAAEPTQQWSPEGQQQWTGQEQGQQWPQEQQQWGGADSGQQWGAGQEQYGQPAQQEWPAQDAAQPEQHQSWPQEGQAWQADAAPAAEQPAEAAVPEGADETRVETPVSEPAKDEDGQQQQGQGGQQGWWSQPS